MQLLNHKHSGLVVSTYTSDFILVSCSNTSNIQVDKHEYGLIILDVVIIVCCIVSLALSFRSIFRANTLKTSFVKFYQKKYGKGLDFWDKMVFFNFWHFLIIINDVLIICGTCLKLDKYYFINYGDQINLDAVTVLLGLGCLCMWVGLLRYIGYFHEYNKLVLTMKKSLPPILRFLVCAAMLYVGFLFCGWLVLGPYHPKFRSLIVASEALFSLINGDDMYMTYEEMGKKSYATWIFSQIFLYVFISLFIYMVLSAFIAVITDEYEDIKNWEKEGSMPPQSKVEEVLKDLTASTNSNFEDFLHQDTYCFFCCYHNNDFVIDSDSEAEDLPITRANQSNSINGGVPHQGENSVVSPSNITYRPHTAYKNDHNRCNSFKSNV